LPGGRRTFGKGLVVAGLKFLEGAVMKTNVSRSNKFSRSLLFFSVLLMAVLISVWARAEQAILGWDANTEADLAGYRIHYGTASGSYTTHLDVHNVTAFTVTGLSPGQTYYFAASAYDIYGNESGYSNEVSHSIPAANGAPSTPPAPPADTNGQDLYPRDPVAGRDSDGDGIEDSADPDGGNNAIAGGREPNFPPDAPVPVAPAANAIVGLTPLLRTAAFQDPDAGDSHARSRWQIVQSPDGRVVLDVTSTADLTSLQVPRLVLDENTVYEWRVIFTDSRGASSPWSQPGSFATDFDSADSNGNGLPDDQEADGSIDLDGDGRSDAVQPEIKSIALPARARQIGIQAGGHGKGVAIVSLESAEEDVVDCDVDLDGIGDETPFGIIHFKLIVDTPGDEAVVTVHFSDPAPRNGRWYKYDPLRRKWSDFSAQAVFSDDRRSMTLTLRDGGEADADGVSNGVIVDPAGVVVASSSGAETAVSSTAGDVANSSGSGGGGCFINTAAGHGGSPATLLCWLGLISLAGILGTRVANRSVRLLGLRRS
jgi:hypothetical protein